jgi:putative membrane protein
MYSFNGFPFHIFGFGFLPMILFWGLIIYGIYFLVKQVWSPQKQSALEILKARYAKGEITREEFENMKKDIK